MDQPTDSRLKKGARVRLSGLTTQVLNGAEGKIVDFPDASTGRFPVAITSPPEAVAAFKDGVKVRPQNLEPLAPPPSERRVQDWKQRQEEAARRFPHRSVEGRPSSVGFEVHEAAGGFAAPRHDAWAAGLTRSQQQEWLVDCYRMRVDDDMCWGAGYLHGLYAEDYTADSILLDFLLFCKLAVRHGVVPQGWDWQAFLKTAAGLLLYAFEKADAKEKYGRENFFNAFLGGRSLRATAEVVYGSSCMGLRKPSEGEMAVRAELTAARSVPQLLSSGQLLADVGGVEPWTRLRAALQRGR